MENKLFPSISFHITKPCNMGCKFCYSAYENLGRVKMLSFEDSKIILKKLADAGVRKVTFAGGEPMLHPDLDKMIIFAKADLSITTSIITNGSLLSLDFMDRMQDCLDWVGLSIDSFDFEINKKIGRVERGQQLATPYRFLLSQLNKRGFKVKVNSVVNAYNYADMCSTIDILNNYKIDRFKILRTLPVNGENNQHWNEVACTDEMWKQVMGYVNLYYSLTDAEDGLKRNIKTIVPEDNKAMTASYLLVGPTGQIYDNSKGEHTFGPTLLNHSVEECLKPLNLDYDNFIQRGGLYDWDK